MSVHLPPSIDLNWPRAMAATGTTLRGLEKWWSTAEQVVGHNACRPEVASLVVRIPLDHFRSHVVKSAREARHRWPGICQHCSQSKIDELQLVTFATGTKNKICMFQVS